MGVPFNFNPYKEQLCQPETISDVVLALEEYKEVATSDLPDNEDIVDSLNEIESDYEDELRDKDINYDDLQDKCDDLEEE